MLVSPSIASSDLLNISKEIDYIDKYFNNIHIDIEDGVALLGISFGIKMTKKVCSYSRSKEKTIHVEVLEPMNYIEDLKSIPNSCVFVQISHLKNPIEVISAYKQAGIKTGVNFNIKDLKRNELDELINSSDDFLISTTDPFDPKQDYLPVMEDFALKLADNKKKRVWIDGCVSYETYNRLKDSNLYCAVIGRAIFNDEQLAIKLFSDYNK